MYRTLLKIVKIYRNEGTAELLRKVKRQLVHLTTSEVRIHGTDARLEIGEHVNLNDALLNTLSGEIIIEDNVTFGRDVSLVTGTHEYEKKGRERANAVPEEGRDIVIREGAFVGTDATIIGPCEIGPHAVIAAGSVVFDDCEGGAIYGGNPAELIRNIDFD